MFALALPPMLLLSWFPLLSSSPLSLFSFCSLFRFFFSLLFSLEFELYLSDIHLPNYKQTGRDKKNDPFFFRKSHFSITTHHPHFQNASQEDRWCLCGQAQGYSCLVPGLFTFFFDFFRVARAFCGLAKRCAPTAISRLR